MNRHETGGKPCTPKLFCSPIGLLLITALSIFVAEAIVMIVLSALPDSLSILAGAVLDAVILTIIILPVLYMFFYRPLRAHIAERERAEVEREKLIAEIRTALEGIKVLSGLLPVCASCKRIREGGRWVSMEKYITERSNAQFTHSICDECAERLYGIGEGKTGE